MITGQRLARATGGEELVAEPAEPAGPLGDHRADGGQQAGGRGRVDLSGRRPDHPAERLAGPAVVLGEPGQQGRQLVPDNLVPGGAGHQEREVRLERAEPGRLDPDGPVEQAVGLGRRGRRLQLGEDDAPLGPVRVRAERLLHGRGRGGDRGRRPGLQGEPGVAQGGGPAGLVQAGDGFPGRGQGGRVPGPGGPFGERFPDRQVARPAGDDPLVHVDHGRVVAEPVVDLGQTELELGLVGVRPGVGVVGERADRPEAGRAAGVQVGPGEPEVRPVPGRGLGLVDHPEAGGDPTFIGDGLGEGGPDAGVPGPAGGLGPEQVDGPIGVPAGLGDGRPEQDRLGRGRVEHPVEFGRHLVQGRPLGRGAAPGLQLGQLHPDQGGVCRPVGIRRADGLLVLPGGLGELALVQVRLGQGDPGGDVVRVPVEDEPERLLFVPGVGLPLVAQGEQQVRLRLQGRVADGRGPQGGQDVGRLRPAEFPHGHPRPQVVDLHPGGLGLPGFELADDLAGPVGLADLDEQVGERDEQVEPVVDPVHAGFEGGHGRPEVAPVEFQPGQRPDRADVGRVLGDRRDQVFPGGGQVPLSLELLGREHQRVQVVRGDSKGFRQVRQGVRGVGRVQVEPGPGQVDFDVVGDGGDQPVEDDPGLGRLVQVFPQVLGQPLVRGHRLRVGLDGGLVARPGGVGLAEPGLGGGQPLPQVGVLRRRFEQGLGVGLGVRVPADPQAEGQRLAADGRAGRVVPEDAVVQEQQGRGVGAARPFADQGGQSFPRVGVVRPELEVLAEVVDGDRVFTVLDGPVGLLFEGVRDAAGLDGVDAEQGRPEGDDHEDQFQEERLVDGRHRSHPCEDRGLGESNVTNPEYRQSTATEIRGTIAPPGRRIG